MKGSLIVDGIEFVTEPQAIVLLQKSKGYFWRMRKQDRLTLYKLGGSNMYRMQDLAALVTPAEKVK